MNDTFGLTQLESDLKLDEGTGPIRNGRLFMYKDSRGIFSLGFGRNLQANGIRPSEAEFMLTNDIADVAVQLDAGAPWWRSMPAPQQRVLLNLCFNMGWDTLKTFTTFLSLMQAHKFPTAAADLQTTAWYKQVGERGPRMIQRLAAV